MEIWHAASLFFGLVGAILLVLLWLGDKVADLTRTLKRIEARLTLISPLDEEKTLLDKGIATLEGGLKDRAMHPDIWSSQAIERESDLRGKKWREAYSLRRYREKRHRD